MSLSTGTPRSAPASRRTAVLADLGPVAQLRAGRLGRRLPQLVIGLALFGVALGLMVQAGVGVAPWDVLTLGLVRWTPLSFGQLVIGLSFVVLLLWIPLREKPGLGTIANAVLIGLAADATLKLVDPVNGWFAGVALMVAGLVLNAVAGALYIGAQLGRGPRDGLMTGLSRRTGWSLRGVRTGIELSVLALGVALGGAASLGVGTLLYAFGIGPLTQAFLPWALVRLDPGAQSASR